ncbi:MAG: HD domain-containing protein [Deltaproteobacteria bacterium]|nr:HD domain-containing protein [Deltaproteobacteria bacterium]
MDRDRYKAIPPCALIPGTLPDFQIYMRSPEGRFILWALEGNKVSPEQLARLTAGGTKEVYINLDDEFKYEQHLEANLGTILENTFASNDNKASIFTKVSTHVLKDAFETSLGLGVMDSGTMDRTKSMVQSALTFITESKSLQALAKMIGHDYQTYEHATKVLWFTVAFLKFNPEFLDRIEPERETIDDDQRMELLHQCGVGALLHDIGKAFVPRKILNKNEPLTEIEWEIVKRHPLNSLAMLIDSELPPFVKKGVLFHHENFHGGGYPMNLEGEGLPVLARVLRIVDVFDAMTSRRPYKDPMPAMKAAQIMIGRPEDRPGNGNGNGKQDDRDRGMRQCFDEELLRKFIVFLGNVRLDR